MSFYSEATLVKMSIAELKTICKKFNICQGNFIEKFNILGKKKIQFVQNIWIRVNSLYEARSAVDAIKKHVESTRFADPALLHKFYREWFNLIDLTDRQWYSV